MCNNHPLPIMCTKHPNYAFFYAGARAEELQASRASAIELATSALASQPRR